MNRAPLKAIGGLLLFLCSIGSNTASASWEMPSHCDWYPWIQGYWIESYGSSCVGSSPWNNIIVWRDIGIGDDQLVHFGEMLNLETNPESWEDIGYGSVELSWDEVCDTYPNETLVTVYLYAFVPVCRAPDELISVHAGDGLLLPEDPSPLVVDACCTHAGKSQAQIASVLGLGPGSGFMASDPGDEAVYSECPCVTLTYWVTGGPVTVEWAGDVDLTRAGLYSLVAEFENLDDPTRVNDFLRPLKYSPPERRSHWQSLT